MRSLAKFFLAAVAALALFYFSSKYFLPELMRVLHIIAGLLVPFIAALVLAVFMEPLVKVLVERMRLKRAWAAILTMLLVLGIMLFLLTLLVTRLVVELIDLSVTLPRYVEPVQHFLQQTLEQGRFYYFKLPAAVTDTLQNSMQFVTGKAAALAAGAANQLLAVVSSLPSLVLGIIVTLIATYFLLRDRHVITLFWLNTVPAPWGKRVLEVVQDVSSAFMAYVRAQLMLISFTTLQAIVGLYIIGAKYALTIGLVLGFLDLIPVLGPATLLIPWGVWAIISGQVAFGIKLIVLYLLLWLVRQLLEARVVAGNMGLHPLAVLLAMYAGLRLLGVVGLVLGPISIIALQAVYRSWVKYRQI